jgi:hypothetical protein
MTIKIPMDDLVEILEENYYVLTVTGRQALIDIRSDLDHGLFNVNHKEWGTNDGDILDALVWMEKEFVRENKMDLAAGEWHSRRRKSLAEDPAIQRLVELAQLVAEENQKSE